MPPLPVAGLSWQHTLFRLEQCLYDRDGLARLGFASPGASRFKTKREKPGRLARVPKTNTNKRFQEP
uniref:Uncharacterized protein n=1 Tax=Candidatus Kentrum sp. TC TaxID=2126339 RepID=A0A450Z371_9GAMM|nr:MAG: hypothetical protein BECKTC1821E_GA0114239_11075 [Candidatus Kentron sp. TC]